MLLANDVVGLVLKLDYVQTGHRRRFNYAVIGKLELIGKRSLSSGGMTQETSWEKFCNTEEAELRWFKKKQAIIKSRDFNS